MDRVVSLIYIECGYNDMNVSSNLQGPFIFQCEDAAKDALKNYVIERILERFPDKYAKSLIESADSSALDFCHGEPDSFNLTDFFRQNGQELSVDSLAFWYVRACNQAGGFFQFKLQEIPAMSLCEAIKGADAFMLDGSFITEYYLHPNPVTRDDCVLELSKNEQVVMSFNKHDLLNAYFNNQTEAWVVNSCEFQPIKFCR